MTSLFDNRIGFHCPAEKWRRAPHSGHVGMHCAHSGGGRAPFALRFLPRKSSRLESEGFINGPSRPSFRFHTACSFAGSRKASTRRVTNNLPTRASNILCGVRQLCQVKLSQRQLCQVKLSHAVSQTSPCCEKRQFNLAHLSHSGAFVLNRILQQPAQVVAEALAIIIGESRGTLGTAPSAPHFLFLMPKK